MAKPHIRHNASGAPTDDSDTSKFTPAVSCAPTSAPSQASTPASTSVLGPLGRYTDENLQKAIKLTLKLFVKGQEHSQANFATWDRAVKAQNSDLYYRSSYMKCYYICRQCKDNFDTAGATGHKRVPFAALFVRDRINFCW